MTALTHTSPQAPTSQAATSHNRTSRFVTTLAVGLVAAVSGLAPAASVLLGM